MTSWLKAVFVGKAYSNEKCKLKYSNAYIATLMHYIKRHPSFTEQRCTNLHTKVLQNFLT